MSSNVFACWFTAMSVLAAACGNDPTPAGADARSSDDAAVVVDGGDVDAAVTVDAATPEIDAAGPGIDAAVDAAPRPAWSLQFPGEAGPRLTATPTRLWAVSRINDRAESMLRTIVDGEVTASQTLPVTSAELASHGEFVYLKAQIDGVVELWGQPTGTAFTNDIVIAKLGPDGQPIWRVVLVNATSDDGGFAVDSNGDVVAVFTHWGQGAGTAITRRAAADGRALDGLELPGRARVVATATGKVFVSGALWPGQVLGDHQAIVAETYLIKANASLEFPIFTRFLAADRELLGLHDGDPIFLGPTAAGRSELARVSGADGVVLWRTIFDQGGVSAYTVASADGATFSMFGTFDDRIDFTPSLRLESHGTKDIFVATVDGTAGTILTADHLASGATDRASGLLPGPCPVLAGEAGDPFTIGADLLALPAGAQGAFIATMCP